MLVPIKNYTRKSTYELIVRPSPNLPNSQSIALYPSLCLLEPTVISIGRGTEFQFQVYGHPKLPKGDFSFTPKPNFGAKSPKLENNLSYGKNLTQVPKPEQLELKWLIDAYRNFPKSNTFFLNGFNRIAGNSILKEQIISGISEKEIRKSWRPKLKNLRKLEKNTLFIIREYLSIYVFVRILSILGFLKHILLLMASLSHVYPTLVVNTKNIFHLLFQLVFLQNENHLYYKL
jgi:hypothetical protein